MNANKRGITVERFNQIAVLVERQIKEEVREDKYEEQIKRACIALKIEKVDMDRFLAQREGDVLSRKEVHLFGGIAPDLQVWRFKNARPRVYGDFLYSVKMRYKLDHDEIFRFAEFVKARAAS